MSSEIAIRVRGLSKCYNIYDKPHDRLKQALLTTPRSLLGLRPRQYCREFWALKDISFEIFKGETVGIIGRNGSGKSTLLQLICGTLSPTGGTIETRGPISVEAHSTVLFSKIFETTWGSTKFYIEPNDGEWSGKGPYGSVGPCSSVGELEDILYADIFQYRREEEALKKDDGVCYVVIELSQGDYKVFRVVRGHETRFELRGPRGLITSLSGRSINSTVLQKIAGYGTALQWLIAICKQFLRML